MDPIGVAHAPANNIDMTRARYIERAIDCTLAFSIVFTPYLWNAVVSGKSPS